MQKITSLTKHVDELEMKPDALPDENSRLQGRADGAAAPGPDPEQGAVENGWHPACGLQRGKGALNTLFL